MTDEDQIPDGAREFGAYLRGLVSWLDQGAGWCAVFWQRDPEGMKACLDGREVPPWDVVESLLQDLAAVQGADRAAQEGVRARALQRASARAHDRGPGAADALADRLDVMAGERRYAAERLRELGRRLGVAATREEAESIRLDLAWARDDHERASARMTELQERQSCLRVLPAQVARQPPAARRESVAERGRRPRGGARFAGMIQEEPAIQDAGPATPVPARGVGTPRGARFAGSPEVEAEGQAAPPARSDPTADREVAVAVDTLLRLRAQGRSGEAHTVLADAAHGPAARLPLLAARLHRAGLDADWTTLLWEAASLPPDRLVDAADALTAAGRDADGQQVLRQGVGRAPAEIGEAVGRLDAAGRHREARSLLDAYVRGRTPEEAARSAHSDPGRLVPLVVAAARAVSAERHWDVVHALRLAGLTT
ncbi:hypothetical protein ACIREE_14610 [Streptomyces sp. NPDC102467]|uniref:hypothetical protein n=1 Tax=Streptomyces sp. NPDC102467 TaxID=3366179 RepID=UPI003811D6E9